MRILIVDDDSRRAEGLKLYLSEEASVALEDVAYASCVIDARELLKNIYFDVIVLDVVLPKRKDKKSPSHLNGFELLQQLARQATLRKPEKIIGITAHLEDIETFRTEFEASCNIVVEAPSNSDEWKKRIATSLSYIGDSKTSRAVSVASTAVITVHGIRTFGQWQYRLRRLIEARTTNVDFHSYKFGYFSSLLFLIPWFRVAQVSRLATSIRPLLKNKSYDRVFIFCHSFGTYLVAYALLRIFENDEVETKITLILSGSVLDSEFDWSRINSGQSLRVINDCGDRDFILWLSAAFVLGVGMAGKLGFFGLSNRFVMNRYFRGGHSLYFNRLDFIPKYWLPLLDQSSNPEDFDERENAPIHLRVIEGAVRLMKIFKPWIYAIGACVLLYRCI